MKEQEIRIAIIHGDRLYRESLGQCLAQRPDMVVVSNSSSLTPSDDSLVTCDPEILLVQFGLHRSQIGLAIPQATIRDVKRIIVAVPDTEDDILSCMEDGAAGYVLVDSSLEELIITVQAAINGETLCSPRIANLAFQRMSALARRPSSIPAQEGTYLTKREAEIANLIDEGLSNKEIAMRLHIEVSTVKNHVHNILDKLHIHNRHSAVKYLKGHSIPSGSCL